MVATQETIDKVKEVTSSYKYGFVTELEAEKAPLGLSEEIVKFISNKKKEPKWLLVKSVIGRPPEIVNTLFN